MDSSQEHAHGVALKGALDEIKADYKELNDGDVLFQKISDRLHAIYNNPPVTECQSCLAPDCGVILTIDATRTIMFNPSLDHVKYYPLFLKGVSAYADSEAAAKAKSIFLTLLFLVHR